MKITRKMSKMVGMACCMISLWRQEVIQLAILMFQASSTTAHCTMKTDAQAQAFFTIAVTARVIMTKDNTLSAVAAVEVVLAVVIAYP